jgi:hypothetical protein
MVSFVWKSARDRIERVCQDQIEIHLGYLIIVLFLAAYNGVARQALEAAVRFRFPVEIS